MRSQADPTRADLWELNQCVEMSLQVHMRECRLPSMTCMARTAGNEADVGAAVMASGVSRDQLYITTKVGELVGGMLFAVSGIFLLLIY